jgi:AcrR family transcriptional regulator
MSEVRDPIREQLIEARRNQILDAATEVFSRRGYHRATTKEIARTAGISEGTIYNYFRSKDELLMTIMSRFAQAMQLEEMLDQALPDDPREFFAAMLRYRQSFAEQSLPMLRTVMSEILVDAELGERYYQQLIMPFLGLMEQHVQARIEMGQMRPVNVALLARLFVVINVGLLLGLLLSDPVVESGWDSLVDGLVNLLFDGLSPEGGEAAG